MQLRLLQKEVARICGVTEDCITNWERNRSVPQVQFFPQIIKFLEYLPFDVNFATLGGKIKAYRLMNGFSQKKLGEIVGIDGGTICSWELGENQPHKKMLKKLDVMLQGIED
ncbi:transcriptional regulator [Pedobacter sp. MC2016-24]|nr:transcriptional regulator [Pedobacter sp. MC2016-24]